MEKFCILTNKEKDENLLVTEQIRTFLLNNEKQVFVLVEDFSTHKKDISLNQILLKEQPDCVIVLGGDGTMIRTANRLLGTKIPIFGINLGTLGFLTETEYPDMEQALQQLFIGNYDIEQRMMLSVKAPNDFYDTALNDVVITRNGFSRLISVRIYVNEQLVNVYRGDGVIVSTPTGATGYNLSAGGPVVMPNAELILITPICPHTLNARSIIVSSADSLKIIIEKEKKTQEEEAIVTVDGRSSEELQAEDCITIEKSEYMTYLVKLTNHTFFEILREKFRSRVEEG